LSVGSSGVTDDEVTVFSDHGLLQEKNLIKKIPKLGGKPAPDRGVVPCPFYIQKSKGGKTMVAPTPISNDQNVTFAPSRLL
jgi:hypothetical protein